MAKKRSINIFVAYLDKLFLFVMILVLSWVLYACLFSPARVELPSGDSVKASAAAEDALSMAEEYVALMGQDNTTSLPPYSPHAERFGLVPAFKTSAIDTFPLTQINIREGDFEIRREPYVIPQILALKEPVIQFTRDLAWVPELFDEERAKFVNLNDIEGDLDYVTNDVDMVTVEASIPYAEIRDRFKLRFAGPQIPTPLEEHYEPTVAAVELQRSELMPDGQWGLWKSVDRLVVDELRARDQNEDLDITRDSYEVFMHQASSYLNQQAMIQPEPFEFEGTPWVSPKTRAIQLAEEKRERKNKGKAARRSTRGSRRGMETSSTQTRKRRTSVRSKSSNAGGGGGMMPGMMMPGMMMPEMMPGGTQDQAREGVEMQQRRTGPRGGRTYSRHDEEEQKKWLDEESHSVWAHDASVRSGGTYRYRIRVGFFNPIAGKDWFTAEQKDLKSKAVLWTPMAELETIVKVPERTLFVPSPASSRLKDKRVAMVDVYRWQNNDWHKKDFRVSPGSVIGAVEELSNDENETDRDEKRVAIDYSTGLTVIDIIPDSKYWIRERNRMTEVSATDIIYQDKQGTINRIASDNKTWPPEFKARVSQISREIREEKKKRKAK